MIGALRFERANLEVFLDFARRGKNVWWRYLATTICAVAVVLAVGVAVVLTLTLSGAASAEAVQLALTSPADAPRFFAANGVMFGLILAAFAVAVAVIHRKRPLDLVGQWSWGDYGLGAAVWLGALVVLVGVDYLIAPADFNFNGSARTLSLLIWAGVGLLVQTFAEEYIFRGYATQGLLLALKNPHVTAAVSGLLFGVVHVPNGLPQAAAATVLGAALALIAIRRGGIGFGAGLHYINNLFGAAVVVSGADVFKGSPALLQQNSPQLLWWDTFAVALAAVLVAAAVELQFRRCRCH